MHHQKQKDVDSALRQTTAALLTAVLDDSAFARAVAARPQLRVATVRSAGLCASRREVESALGIVPTQREATRPMAGFLA